MRPHRVVAGAALIVALALVAVPGSADSTAPLTWAQIDGSRFAPVSGPDAAWAATTTPFPDPALESEDVLDPNARLIEPGGFDLPTDRPSVSQPSALGGAVKIPVWHWDSNVSFYGPGFYGKRTACGLAYTRTIIGVAHKTLPCGTRVTFRNPANGRTITAPVIDRGPYVAGRQWDLSGGLCTYLRHCYTGPLEWKLG